MKKKLRKGLQCGLALAIATSGFVFPQTYPEASTVLAQEAAPKTTPTVNGVTIQDHLKAGWAKRETNIDVRAYNLTWDDLTSIVFNIHYNEPEYYYIFLNKGYIDKDKDGIVETYVQEYDLDRSKELEEEWLILKEKLDECKTDIEKILVVHDHLCETIQYTDALGSTSHDIGGAILEKRCVCEGYALAFKYYMNRLNIPCQIVTGKFNEPHAWNQVQVDGEWYMLDATHDDTRNPKKTLHDYFLISDSKLLQTHSWDSTHGYHECTNRKYDNYFWTKYGKEMAPYQGKIYYAGYELTSQKYQAGIYSFDIEDPNAKETCVVEIEDFWKTEDGNLNKALSAVAVRDGVLYYTLPKSIWKKDLKNPNSKEEQIFSLPEGSNEYIWDIHVRNGRIYYDSNPTEKGIRPFKYAVTIDKNFQKREQPVAVTSEEYTVYLGGEEQFFKAAAPNQITYTSQNKDMFDTHVVFEDASCKIIPKKEGTAILNVTAAGSDRYHEKTVPVTVHVKKSDADFYFSGDRDSTSNGQKTFTGNVYVAKTNGRATASPTGSVTFKVLGDNNRELTTQTVNLNGYSSAAYNLSVPTGHSSYKVVATYNGDANYAAETIEKAYGSQSSHSHSYTQQKAEQRYLKTAATCTAPAVYYKSCSCGEKSTTETFTYGAKLDHAYGTPSWRWTNSKATATATFDCTRSGCNHNTTRVATPTSRVTTQPTCTQNGTRTYTATVSVDGVSYSDTKTESIAKTGHAYKTPSWSWSGNKATATFTCANNASHKETKVATMTSSVKTNATCTQKGAHLYTATVTFENKTYTTNTTIYDIPVKNHTFKNGVCSVCGAKDPNYQTIKAGWQYKYNRWWYRRADGTFPKAQWEYINNKWYYFDAQGYMVEPGWHYINGKWYYMDANGAALTYTWDYINGKWYYFNASGHMLENTWYYINGYWYYFNAQGHALENTWYYINGSWYYFDAQGHMLGHGWNWINGKCYYMYENGAMASNTWIDGYYVDANGVWVY